MNRRTLFLLTLTCCLPLVGFESTANAQSSDSKAAARKVFDTNHSMVYGIKSMVKLEASMGGKQVMNREMPAYGIGTVIADGMLVTSYRTIKPKAQANVQGVARAQAQGLVLNTNVKDIKLIDGSGEEFDAKLVLHDEDLDLAFVALDRKAENAESWSCEPVDISGDVELSHLDDVVYLSRAGESMRFQPSVRVGQVHTVIKRPRRLYATDNLVLGGASFNTAGQFVGLGIRKASGSGGEFSAVLPAKYIRKLLPQAIEKAANIENEEEEPAEGETSEEGESADDKKAAEEKDDAADEADNAESADDKGSDSDENESRSSDKGGVENQALSVK